MRLESFGPLRARIAGGPDREGGGDGPVVVLLHGFGAPGDDLVSVYRVLDVPREVRFVFPEAPVALDVGLGDARAWWEIDLAKVEQAIAEGEPRDVSSEHPDGLAPAAAALDAHLDAILPALGGGPLVLGGFSQGAMLSLYHALEKPRPIAGLVLLSGGLIAATEQRPRLRRRSGLPVLQSHGQTDPLISFAGATELRDELRAAGLDVRFVEFRGGHEIPPAVLRELETFVRRVTAGAP